MGRSISLDGVISALGRIAIACMHVFRNLGTWNPCLHSRSCDQVAGFGKSHDEKEESKKFFTVQSMLFLYNQVAIPPFYSYM